VDGVRKRGLRKGRIKGGEEEKLKKFSGKVMMRRD